MLTFNKPFYKIINELCEEMDIQVQEYSYGYFRQLKKDGKIRNLMMHKLDLNSMIALNIANDKYATYEFLKSNNIPVINHHMIFNPKTRKEYIGISDIEIAKKLFNKYNGKIVIKANDSFQGKDVFFIDNKEQIEKTIKEIFSKDNNSLSICPFEEIKNEYRVIVLDDECLFSYKKELPKIIGDGIKTIGDYILDLKIERPDKSLNLNYIPKNGEEVYLSWKFNLSNGAIPKDIDDIEKKQIVEKLALDVAKIINIRFASIDIIENIEGEFKIIEVNATVCMNKFVEKYENGYEIAKNIYRKAIEKMFE